MARMSSNAESPRRNYVDIYQLTNWILYSGVTCYMTPDISYFIPGSFVETDEYIEVADGHFFTAKKRDKFKSKCVMTMENPSLMRYIMCYWHQTCAIDYFPLLN